MVNLKAHHTKVCSPCALVEEPKRHFPLVNLFKGINGFACDLQYGIIPCTESCAYYVPLKRKGSKMNTFYAQADPFSLTEKSKLQNAIPGLSRGTFLKQI